MNILITGATGFIAAQLVTDLSSAGHKITCCVRDTAYAKNLFPHATIIACNFIKDTYRELWIPRLKDIDVVINCVGILYHPNKKIIWAVHYDTPRALFDACVKVGIKKIITFSALGVDSAEVDYAKSKKALEDYLLTLPIKSIILRPSLVHGRGSYAGTSLFRGLAGLPSFVPVPGSGKQEFQPIYLLDLSKAIVNLVAEPLKETVILHAVGPKKINLGEILTKIRAWLGFPKAFLMLIPLWCIRIGAFFGDFIPYSALNSSSYKMLMRNNISSEMEANKFYDLIGFTPRDFITGMYSQPSSVQDRWHARLFFLKPALQISIALVWIFTALCIAMLFPKTTTYELLAQIGINDFWQPVMLYGTSIVYGLLGIATLCSYQLRKVGILQIAIIVFSCLVIAWKLPLLWLDPIVALVKNIPLIVAILVLLGLESDR